MNKIYKYIFYILTAVALALIGLTIIYSDQIAVLNPQGIIALKERDLIVIATFLMLLIVLPVLIMTAIFTWKYREENKKAKYTPDWDYSFAVEVFWWGFPFVIVFALSVITWRSTHELDPFKPIESDKKPLTIQVVALQWKWLFIYPEQGIATINGFHLPEQVPIVFEITADAPMNSFWVPELSGQMYAMPGMKTQLHVIADHAGDFRGSSANISGAGFARMIFHAIATSENEFNQWVQSTKQSPNGLDWEEYQKLAKPGVDYPIASFSLKNKELFNQIIMKYMTPMPSN